MNRIQLFLYNQLHRYIRSMVFLCCGLMCCSCDQHTDPVQVSTGVPTVLQPFSTTLSPTLPEQSVHLQQQITVHFAKQIYTLEAVIDIDSDQFNFVALFLGQRVLTLQYDGQSLQSWKHPKLPSQVQGEHVLRYMQLALWPSDILKSALSPEWQLEDDGMQRLFLINDEPTIFISFSDQTRWNGTIRIFDFMHRYRLTIQSVQMDT